jgi:Na+/H+ antiporter NhaD/arsenite permease-like protein
MTTLSLPVQIAAIVIFVVTYLGVALGRLPGLRLDRAAIAFCGAALMIGVGALPLAGAYQAISGNTIALLFGMMVLAAGLRRAGFFALITNVALRRASHPLALLAAIIAIAGFLSALLVNDTICVVITPLVLDIVLALKRNPLPYLMALSASANIGSVATITGNPQDMIIGSISGISYSRFAISLAPVALIGLFITFSLLTLLFRADLRAPLPSQPVASPPSALHRGLLLKSLLLLGLFVIASLAGMPPSEAALIAAALLLLTPGLRSEILLAGVDWSLLVMFIGLFIVIAGLQAAVITPEIIKTIAALQPGRPAILVPLTAILSNLVNNVPTVLVLKPFVAALANPKQAWLLVAMAATFAGNLTLLGSVANLIVAEAARARGITLRFTDYLRLGIPLTLSTLLIGTLYLVFLS